MRRRLVRCGATLLLVWGAPIDSARAACGRPDVVDTLPPDGQALVPTNTRLSASYELGATHLGEAVMVTATPGSRHQLSASYSSALRSLLVTLPSCGEGAAPECAPNPDFPGGQLKPNTEYTVEWPGLGADAGARVGRGATVTFTSGPGPDASSPGFDGAREVRWGFEREYDSCSDTESERYVFDVRVNPPTYAGGEELLVMHVFQTVGRLLRKDENGNAIPEEVHRGRYQGSDWIRITQPIATGFGRVCFSAFAEAPNGLISQGSETEACTRTEHPPFSKVAASGGETRDPARGPRGCSLSVSRCSRGPGGLRASVPRSGAREYPRRVSSRNRACDRSPERPRNRRARRGGRMPRPGRRGRRRQGVLVR